MRCAFTGRPWVTDCVPRESNVSHSESHARCPTLDPELTSRTLANVARLDLRAIRDAIFQRSFRTAFLADSSAGSPLSFKLLFSNLKFAFLAVFTLRLGIGVNASVFSWIDGVLLHPYPRVDTREPALIEMVTLSGEHLVATSYVDVRDYRGHLKLISDLAIGRLRPPPSV